MSCEKPSKICFDGFSTCSPPYGGRAEAICLVNIAGPTQKVNSPVWTTTSASTSIPAPVLKESKRCRQSFTLLLFFVSVHYTQEACYPLYKETGMANTIVHVIPYIQIVRDKYHPPLCEFTEETDPKKWPEGHAFRLEEDSLTHRFLEDFTDQITCAACKEKFKERRRTLMHLQPINSGRSHMLKNPNWVVDIGD